MKVLLDTNVLIAAFITKGVCSELLEHCLRRHDVVVSEFILDEFHKNLVKKFRYSAEDADSVIQLLRSRVFLSKPIPLSQPVCRDVDDDMVIAAALAGRAACIITGDKDLLELKVHQGIAILKPADFSAFEAEHS
ncbi:MAG: putative toxin-antitoxin system toxin component, PIN family [Chloroflexi bacterium]|nr:putative toxin-antitoxin system toxin component, PIN family [Chloroflexota bacterium]